MIFIKIKTKGNKIKTIKKSVVYGTVFLCSLTILYPLLFTVITSLRDKQSYFEDIYSLDLMNLSLNNYIKILNDFEALNKLLNSSIITVGGVVLVLLVGIPAAYFINGVHKGIYISTFVFLGIFAFIPEQVLILSQFKLFLEAGLIDNYLSVILILASRNLPEAIIFSSLIFKAIPMQLIEAARLDGCKETSIIRHIIFPLSIPGMVIISITLMINIWNDFLVSLVMLQDDSMKTIITVLARMDQRHASNPPFQMAGNVLAMLPTFIVYMIFKNKIVENVYGNSLK